MAAIGVAVGLNTALALGRVVASLLYGVRERSGDLHDIDDVAVPSGAWGKLASRTTSGASRSNARIAARIGSSSDTHRWMDYGPRADVEEALFYFDQRPDECALKL